MTSKQTKQDEEQQNEMPVQAVNLSMTQNLSSASDDYFQTVVINALLTMLKDKALDTHHDAVVEAIMSIFKTQGLRCVAFLPQVRSTLI